MRELAKAEYLSLVDHAHSRQGTAYWFLDQQQYNYLGEVIAKERPRGANHYTPTKTKKFEAAVKEWGKKVVETPWLCPVKISIFIFDKTDDATLVRDSAIGLVYAKNKDLDNMGKAICDALNKIAYKDDNQIVHLEIRRRYSEIDGFTLIINRAGLSEHEYATFMRYYNLSLQPA